MIVSDSAPRSAGWRIGPRLAERPLGLFTLASVLFMGGVLGVLAWVDRAGSLAGADGTSQILALALERHVGRTLAELDGTLLVMGEQMRAASLSPDALDARLRILQARLTHNTTLAIIDTSGRLVSASTQPVRRGLDLAGRQLFRDALTEPRDGLFIGQGALIDRQTAAGIARRITDDSGALIGVAYASLDSDAVDGFVREAGLPEGAAVMLMQDDGTVLLRRPGGEDWVGRSLANDPLFIQFVPRLRPGTYHEVALDDRVERITTYRTVQGYPVVVAIGLPSELILRSWRERSLRVLLLWVLSAAALSGIAAVVASRSQRNTPPFETRPKGRSSG